MKLWHIATKLTVFQTVQHVVHTHVQGAIIDSNRSTASSLSATEEVASQVIRDAQIYWSIQVS